MHQETINTTEIHDWLDRMKQGDPKALDELFRRVSSRLERITRNMLNQFSRLKRFTDAEDVVQAASVRLIRSLKEIRPATKREFYSLAATQVRRELLDLSRSLFGPQGIGTNQQSIDSRPDQSGINWDPGQKDDRAELDKWFAFHQGVENLPVEEREVVGLIFYHGWTHAEIAELFQITTKTVQRRWQSALKSLRDVLFEWSPDGSDAT